MSVRVKTPEKEAGMWIDERTYSYEGFVIHVNPELKGEKRYTVEGSSCPFCSRVNILKKVGVNSFACDGCGAEFHVKVREEGDELKVEIEKGVIVVQSEFAKCPACGSDLIDQEASEGDQQFYHCYECGRWYSE